MAADELYLVVCQNNEKRTLKIKEVSQPLADALGRLRSEMEGMELQRFLGDKSRDTVDELMEYAADSKDLDDVLARMREYKLTHHNAQEMLFAHKCYREPPRDQHHWFRILLKDERRQIEEQSLPQLLKQNLAGVYSVDELTGLASLDTCERYLDQVAHYASTHGLTGCFAVLRLDRYEKSVAQYGQAGASQLLQHIAQHCKGRFREEDLVSYLGGGTIGLLLMDTLEESARIVLNRLRGSVASHRISFGGKANFSVTVSIAYSEMLGENGKDVIARVRGAIAQVGEDERSALVKAAL